MFTALLFPQHRTRGSKNKHPPVLGHLKSTGDAVSFWFQMTTLGIMKASNYSTLALCRRMARLDIFRNIDEWMGTKSKAVSGGGGGGRWWGGG